MEKYKGKTIYIAGKDIQTIVELLDLKLIQMNNRADDEFERNNFEACDIIVDRMLEIRKLKEKIER